MKPEERHCALLLDEMQLTTGLDFDPTVKKPIGLATAPLAKQGPEGELVYAKHGLVIMLTGLSSRWKQVVAYHFTGKCSLLNNKILSNHSLKPNCTQIFYYIKILAFNITQKASNFKVMRSK